MVSCPHALASEAGAEILKAGGSAVDAAIAASAVLSVIYPHMTSVGGDAFWLIYDARQRTVRFLNAGGRAAARADIEWFRARGLTEIPLYGVLPATITVPGAVDGWCAAHAVLGRLALGRDVATAIEYARDGFPATRRLAEWTANVTETLARSPEAARIFLPDGRAPKAGQRLRNPDLARTLERIGDAGRGGFYEGETAAELARYAATHGGFFDERDFAGQRSTWGESLRATYRGVTICETPPPTQGLSVLQMLGLVEPWDLGRLDYLSPDHVHLLVQAKMIAYHDRDQFIADPDFVKVPVERLLSKAYLDERRRLIDAGRALAWDRVPSWGSLAGDTVFVAAVDGKGNAAALIQSLYGTYGAGVVAGRTGIVLQNRGAYFSLDPAHPNRLEPGKRPLHTLVASLAFKGDGLWQVLRCMGADGQPQIHLQAYTAMIDFGLDVQKALDSPRWLSGRFGLGEPRDLLNMESRFPEPTFAELARRGHLINRWGPWNERAGHANGITIDPETGVLAGGSDSRSDGAAIGY